MTSGYRYRLERDLSTGELFDAPLSGTVCFVMLNPSTADETEDDPTIRRCMGFARSWGFARLTVGNLWPLRATSPADLLASDDPDGTFDHGTPGDLHPSNDNALYDLFEEADAVVCAWGANATKMHKIGRNGPDIEGMLSYENMPPAFCLGVTKCGQPRHPLYLASGTERLPWPVRAGV